MNLSEALGPGMTKLGVNFTFTQCALECQGDTRRNTRHCKNTAKWCAERGSGHFTPMGTAYRTLSFEKSLRGRWRWQSLSELQKNAILSCFARSMFLAFVPLFKGIGNV